MSLRLKKNDVVMVIKGKDRGKKAKILSFDENRVFLEKVNLVKKHQKPSKANPQGGISEKEGSIAISNVMYFCGKCSKPVRLGAKLLEKRKVRVCKKCGTELDKA